ncbi:MAG: ABC transporter permease [Nocardiopsaceae bacterium]|nr:ABC transporter permease [Nocardiopsaceae bacterium]
MTVTPQAAPPPQAAPYPPQAPAHDSWPGLLRAEWTKIRSVRSTIWSLLAFVVVAVGFSALLATVLSNDWNSPSGGVGARVQLHTDPTSTIYGAGFSLGQLALCVLGVLVMTSEYTTGAIRSSLLAVPRRLPMLAAKGAVLAVLDLIASAVTVFAVFFVFTSIISSHISITLGTPGVLRGTIGGILYLTVIGLFAMAIGGLIRHTAGAVSTVIGIVFVAPILLQLIPGTIANHIYGYWPSVAGQLAGQTTEQPGNVLSPWEGLGVFCLWTVAALVACGAVLAHRDA